jgi:hypothetical protein
MEAKAKPLKSKNSILITKVAGVSAIILQIVSVVILANTVESLGPLALLIVPALMLAVLGHLLSIRYVEYTEDNLIIWAGKQPVSVPIDQIKSYSRGFWGTYVLKLDKTESSKLSKIRVLGNPRAIIS